MKYDVILIGVSAGGMEALRTILPHLPAKFQLPIIIVQHIHPHSDGFLAFLLNRQCRIPVKVADEKEPILGGNVYIAPPNYHLLIEEDRTFALSVDAAVNFARPSIDVLFESAAETFREKAIGIILTGGNMDGSMGLRRVKELQGFAVVQAPETAEIPTMPLAALAATRVDLILPLDKIGPYISTLDKV